MLGRAPEVDVLCAVVGGRVCEEVECDGGAFVGFEVRDCGADEVVVKARGCVDDCTDVVPLPVGFEGLVFVDALCAEVCEVCAVSVGATGRVCFCADGGTCSDPPRRAPAVEGTTLVRTACVASSCLVLGAPACS